MEKNTIEKTFEEVKNEYENGIKISLKSMLFFCEMESLVKKILNYP